MMMINYKRDGKSHL